MKFYVVALALLVAFVCIAESRSVETERAVDADLEDDLDDLEEYLEGIAEALELEDFPDTEEARGETFDKLKEKLKTFYQKLVEKAEDLKGDLKAKLS
uniref:M-zodatoxin-Lt7a n=1 Tax=Lachesana tarabaevi TaxID=379576 RepID=LAT7_LACTA|nr:RecName: Full=M-zodatoxin-Lt7a; Short=M-ZDTX-Lt7a; AltName: Full=Latarcin-7; Short=Ltc-7; Flags: Precursor [Lachesana tarabaevi]CAJ81648.1 latarcin 7 precursor, pLtc7 [Lachesana tarabaevi]